jgi:hypothetical protein
VQVHGSSTLCGNSETQQSVSGVTDAEKEDTEEGRDCQPAPADRLLVLGPWVRRHNVKNHIRVIIVMKKIYAKTWLI